MSKYEPTRCKHGIDSLRDCPDCENEFSLELDDEVRLMRDEVKSLRAKLAEKDQEASVRKEANGILRSETARLTAELARVEKERDEAAKRFQLETLRTSEYAQIIDRFIADHGPPHVVERECCRLVGEAMKLRARSINDAEANAAITRAKSAEDRAGRLAEAVRMADLLEKAAAKMIFHESGDTHIRVSDDDVSERADLVRRWSTYRESFGNLYDTCDANHDLTPPGDAGKGGG